MRHLKSTPMTTPRMTSKIADAAIPTPQITINVMIFPPKIPEHKRAIINPITNEMNSIIFLPPLSINT